jgi:hypothetical protein
VKVVLGHHRQSNDFTKLKLPVIVPCIKYVTIDHVSRADQDVNDFLRDVLNSYFIVNDKILAF